MGYSKLKNLARQAKDLVQHTVLQTKEKVASSFSMEEVMAKMNACQQYFSENELLQKLTKVAKSAGAGLVYPVLLLFNLLKSPDVDNSQKAMILGALGYFILPLDIIPDAIPIEGFADDLAAITFVLKAYACNISASMRSDAKQQLRDWIGDYDEGLTNGVDKIIDSKLINK